MSSKAAEVKQKKVFQSDNSSFAEFESVKYLEPNEAVFSINEGGILTLNLNGKEYNKVDLYRAFPFRFKDKYISVRDENGDEIGMIFDLNKFNKASKEAILHELNWRYFSPIIKRVISVKEEFGYIYWDVETDRGFKKFVTRSRDQGLQLVNETRLLVTDMTGNRFEIPDIRVLDAKSKHLIETLV
ncbi:MAG: DUF1854 domain-containing protein [Firmicutes bacterium]|nr:DUF1854 domain-containing protein [Bacillota bacterium]